MKKLNILFLGFSLVLISSCATASFTQTGEKFPRYEGPVKIFAKTPKDVVYVEVGRVSSKHGIFRNDVRLIKALQKKAAKKGANAIVLIPNRPTQQVSLPGEGYGFYSRVQTNNAMNAIAIHIIKVL